MRSMLTVGMAMSLACCVHTVPSIEKSSSERLWTRAFADGEPNHSAEVYLKQGDFLQIGTSARCTAESCELQWYMIQPLALDYDNCRRPPLSGEI